MTCGANRVQETTPSIRTMSDMSCFNTPAPSFLLIFPSVRLQRWNFSCLLWFLTPDQRSAELSAPTRRPVLLRLFPNSGTADIDVTGKVIATEEFGTNLA